MRRPRQSQTRLVTQCERAVAQVEGCWQGVRRPHQRRWAPRDAAALRSAGMKLASIEATGGVSIGRGSRWSAAARIETLAGALFAAFRVLLAFLVFFGCFGVEALGLSAMRGSSSFLAALREGPGLRYLKATTPLAPTLTRLR